MPYTTRAIHRRAAHLINKRGLHDGPNFVASRDGALDLSAAYYLAAEGLPMPPEFLTEELAAIRIIECSAGAMRALRELSESLDAPLRVTQITEDHQVPDYIEHVSNWAVTTPVFGTRPPTVSEVIGRILRAADAQDHTPRIPRPRTAA